MVTKNKKLSGLYAELDFRDPTETLANLEALFNCFDRSCGNCDNVDKCSSFCSIVKNYRIKNESV